MILDLNLIQDTKQLQCFCQNLSFEQEDDRFITIDTEFISERTYRPQLCLIQIADAKKAVAIDPLARDINLQCLWDVIKNKDIVKVLHGGQCDIELFCQRGIIPSNIFDTQIAAMVCGFGDSVSYVDLVRHILKMQIDKSARRTDWASRPLSASQLAYALEDVSHLREVYLWFREELRENKWKFLFEQEMAVLLDQNTDRKSPEQAWKQIKSKSSFKSLNQLSLTVAKELAVFRDKLAEKVNVPRNNIIHENALCNIAKALPKTSADLKILRDKPSDPALCEEILEIVKAVCQWPPEKLESIVYAPSSAEKNVAALLQMLLKICSEASGVAQHLICAAKDLEFISRKENSDEFLMHSSPVMQDWRFHIFGKEALDLKSGRLALTIEDGHVKQVVIDTQI